MEYSNHTVSELAADDLFIEWVKTGHCEKFDWPKWLSENPHKIEMVEEGRALVLAFAQERPAYLSKSKEEEMWFFINNTIDSSFEFKPRKKTDARWKYAVAAVISFALVGWFGYQQLILVPDLNQEKAPVAVKTNPMLEYVNETKDSHRVVLSDGSSVVLEPHSKLKYPKEFTNNRREVSLVGEGFFEVTKNPKKPFLVFAHELVTKVLGTSFTIRAFENERNVKVKVKTGKVSVFAKDAKGSGAKGKVKQDTTFLTPNQQAVFSRDKLFLVKSLVEAPDMPAELQGKYSFEFSDTPIKEVFQLLETTYGVEIVYNEGVLDGCRLNASLGDLPFYDKLKLICKAIKANYEVSGVHIVISGPGCQ